MGLLYGWLKYNTRFIAHLYFRNVMVSGLENIPSGKPVMLLPNHPNSFLDPSLLAASLKRPTHFLARGDVFKSPLAAFFLRAVNILPIFRESEGRGNLTRNYSTFDACQKIFEKRGMVVVFPEGLARNNWDFRALKKGPYRIARTAWKSETPANELILIPVGITYEHYKGAGNTLIIQIGKAFNTDEFLSQPNENAEVSLYFKKLTDTIPQLSFIHPEFSHEHPDFQRFRSVLQNSKQPESKTEDILEQARKLNGDPAKVSHLNWIQLTGIFYPLYRLCLYLPHKIIKDTNFHDAIRFALFLLLWPFYLLMLGILINITICYL